MLFRIQGPRRFRFHSRVQKGLTLCILGLGFQSPSARLVDALADFDANTDQENVAAVLPAKLSLTGLYDNVALKTRRVTEGIFAYEVNTPLWSDGASKERFITIPVGTKIIPTDTTNYKFPDKTILIKNFSIDTVYGDSNSRILIETRFLILHPDSTPGVIGLTYRWRRDQTDADLVDPSTGMDEIYNVTKSGVVLGKKWLYPSKFQCTSCHRGHTVLGFITPQLNRPSQADASVNQLAAFFTANLLSANPLAGKATPTFRWVGLKETNVTPPTGMTLLEWKARSYLAANCAHCHGDYVSAEGAAHSFDFLYGAARSPVYDAEDPNLQRGFLGRPSVKEQEFPQLVYKGYPESSYVVRRMMSRSFVAQMPPLASFQIDSTAINVMKDWVCSLGARGSACQLPADQETDDRFWTTGLEDHVIAMTKAKALQAHFQGSFLTVGGDLGGNARLLDPQGRQLPLLPLGLGRYRILSSLRPGLYFVKSGHGVARVQYLP